MIQLSMSGQHLLAGRVVVATVTETDRYRALLLLGTRPAVAQALLANLITLKAR